MSGGRRGTALSARREWTRRLLIWSGAALALAVLEQAFFARLTFLSGCLREPDLILPLVLWVALQGGEEEGASAGVLAGFLRDAVAGTALSVSPLLFGLAGFLCGYFGRGFFARNLQNFVAWLAITATGKQLLLLTADGIAALAGRIPPVAGNGPVLSVLFGWLSTLLLAFPVYAVLCLPARRRQHAVRGPQESDETDSGVGGV